jgi:hypothetical protein
VAAPTGFVKRLDQEQEFAVNMEAKRAELEEAQRELETKIKHIAITQGKTEKILASNNQQRIERHCAALQVLVGEADSSKRIVEELKITIGEEVDTISGWADAIENTIGQADIDVYKLQNWIAEANEHTKARSRKDQLDFEKELFEIHYKAQLGESERQQVEGETSSSRMSPRVEAKLPKLVITKFNGTYQDWPRFWNQFQETIDKSSVSNVTKFSYLRELLDRRVKPTIGALPFTN